MPAGRFCHFQTCRAFRGGWDRLEAISCSVVILYCLIDLRDTSAGRGSSFILDDVKIHQGLRKCYDLDKGTIMSINSDTKD